MWDGDALRRLAIVQGSNECMETNMHMMHILQLHRRGVGDPVGSEGLRAMLCSSPGRCIPGTCLKPQARMRMPCIHEKPCLCAAGAS
jgi:hypothetical protein